MSRLPDAALPATTIERLHRILRDAAFDLPPPADGSVDILGGVPGPVDAVVAFTAHHLIVADLDPALILERLPRDDMGAPLRADFLAWLGTALGSSPGFVDLVLAAAAEVGTPALQLSPQAESAHPRVARSLRLRTNVRVYSDAAGQGTLIVGQGLAGRWEMAFEAAPAGEPVFAQVAAGNAASLRAILAAGYRPIGSEVLFQRRRGLATS